MENHNRRRSSFDRASVEAIFNNSGVGASPPAHVGTSPNRANFSIEHPTPQSTLRPRPLSYSGRKQNRLSLSFPVAPSINSNDSTRPTPTSSHTFSFPSTQADKIPLPSPNDPTGFLTALASQERKVLELKEELGKAESELTHLKKQWAYHEATRKRAEIRNVQPLQSVTAEGVIPVEEAAKRQSLELDRRKALLLNIPKIPKGSRRVIRGGHTRTLSLLSPDRATYNKTFSALQEVKGESPGAGLPRSTTMPDTSQGISRINSNRARHSYQGGVTLGAKQIAEDVKAGLWTFLEDLRQATVGEEGVNGATNRSADTSSLGLHRRSSKGSLLSSERGRRAPSPRAPPNRTWDSLTGANNVLLDAANSLWQDGPARTPSKSPVALKRKPARPLSTAPIMDDDDGWSNWDSPVPKSPLRWSGSSGATTASDPATPSNSNSDDLVQ